MQKKTEKRIRLKKKIRAKIAGTAERPRFTIFRSNKFIYAQLIDDTLGKTIAEASDIKFPKSAKMDRARKVGSAIAEKALAKKVQFVVFDRNGFKYTGRIKTVADEARKGGLVF